MGSPGRSAILLGLLFGLAGTGTSAVTVALPELARDLQVTPSAATWMISAYAVALAVATPLHGRLADMVGIRWPLCIGLAAMTVGAAVAALAPTFPVLLGARIVQGIGAAAVPVLATALVSTRWQGSDQAAALGRIAGVAVTFGALGPLLGGALADLGSWRWALALPVLGVLAIPALWRAAPSTGTGQPIDRVGAVLVALAATGLVLLIQSPSAGLVAAGVGAALIVTAVPATTAWVRAHPDGFLPLSIVTDGTVLRSAFAAAAVPASWFALLLGVPLIAAAWGWTPLATGLLLLPAAVVGFGSPRLAQVLLARWGARRCLVVAGPTAVAALLVAALGGATSSPVLLALAVVLNTVAFGVGQPAMISAVGAAVPAGRRGVALGIATLIFLVGASVGAALIGGLAEILTIPGAFLVLIALPVAGVLTLLRGRVDRTATTPV